MPPNDNPTTTTTLSHRAVPSAFVILRSHRKGGLKIGLVESDSGRLAWGTAHCRLSDVVIELTELWSGKVIAGIGYDICKRARRLDSFGTFVSPAYRQHGLATLLWSVATKHERAQEVRMTLISDRGRTLAQALDRDIPDVLWTTCDGGKRKLRVLKPRRPA